MIVRLTSAFSDLVSAASSSLIGDPWTELAKPLASPVASTMSEGVRTALLALLGLLIVIFGCVIAFAFVIRGRPGVGPGASVDAPGSEGETEGEGEGENEGDPIQTEREVPIRDPMVCSTCRREFDAHLRYCPHDATRLIPAPQMLTRLAERRRSSHICPRCRSKFAGSTRFCPRDGSELLPVATYKATRSSSADTDRADEHRHSHEHGHEHGHEHVEDSDGEIGKICPECQGRYKYGASFCGKDGVELVILN